MNYRTNFNSSFANRGMALENDINETNKYYREYDIALVYKKPTPIRITKTNYQNMRVTDGFFECPSTLDYNGVYKGYYIEFDAKETRSKTSFTINNIHNHQIEYIKKVIKHGGIVFLIVRFTLLDKNYILKGKDLIQFIDSNNRKSIPLSYFEENCYKIDRTEKSKTCFSCEHRHVCRGDSTHTWNFDLNEPNYCIHKMLKEKLT